jgi:hypothetical protein
MSQVLESRPRKQGDLLKDTQALVRICRGARILLFLAVVAVIPIEGFGQNPDPLSVTGKLRYHAESVYSPWSIAGTAAYAGGLQAFNSPEEWGQGAEAYGKRFASTMAWAGVYHTLAFGLDATLHEDPRYFPSGDKGFWRRTGHALRLTILTRTDRGGETLSVWRLGSAYGSAFLSDEWYPDRFHTVKYGLIYGTVTVGFGFAANLGKEFWPDVKRKVFHK